MQIDTASYQSVSTDESSERKASRTTVHPHNVSQRERAISGLCGAIILATGAYRGRLLLAACGLPLLYRGWTGNCRVYEALGIDTANDSSTTGVSGLQQAKG